MSTAVTVREIKRGNTLDLQMQVFKNGTALDITGKTLRFLLKKEPDDSDAEAVITFTAGDGLTVTAASTGNFTLDATAAEMNLAREVYYAGLQIVDGAEVIEVPSDAPFELWKMVGQLVLATS